MTKELAHHREVELDLAAAAVHHTPIDRTVEPADIARAPHRTADTRAWQHRPKAAAAVDHSRMVLGPMQKRVPLAVDHRAGRRRPSVAVALAELMIHLAAAAHRQHTTDHSQRRLQQRQAAMGQWAPTTQQPDDEDRGRTWIVAVQVCCCCAIVAAWMDLASYCFLFCLVVGTWLTTTLT